MSSSPIGLVGLSPSSPSSIGNRRITGELIGKRILVPLLNKSHSTITNQLTIAATLARRSDASLYVVRPVTLPEQTPLGLRHQDSTEEDQSLLEYAFDEATKYSVGLEGKLLFTHCPVNGILRSIETNDIDTLVLPTESAETRLRQSVTKRLSARAPCDVITVHGRPSYDKVPSILLPVAGGPHSGLAADVAQRIAEVNDAWIDVLHIVKREPDESQHEQAGKYVETVCQRISRPETTTPWVLEADDVTETIIEQSQYYTLTVLGAPTTGRLRQFVFGSKSQTIRKNAQSVVLSVRNHTG